LGLKMEDAKLIYIRHHLDILALT